MRSGAAHWWRRRRKRRKWRIYIKSNNPHLTGGEKIYLMIRNNWIFKLNYLYIWNLSISDIFPELRFHGSVAMKAAPRKGPRMWKSRIFLWILQVWKNAYKYCSWIPVFNLDSTLGTWTTHRWWRRPLEILHCDSKSIVCLLPFRILQTASLVFLNVKGMPRTEFVKWIKVVGFANCNANTFLQRVAHYMAMASIVGTICTTCIWHVARSNR